MLSIQASNPSSGSVSEEFIINFSDIEQLASLALDMCSDTYHVLLIPFWYSFFSQLLTSTVTLTWLNFDISKTKKMLLLLSGENAEICKDVLVELTQLLQNIYSLL